MFEGLGRSGDGFPKTSPSPEVTNLIPEVPEDITTYFASVQGIDLLLSSLECQEKRQLPMTLKYPPLLLRAFMHEKDQEFYVALTTSRK